MNGTFASRDPRCVADVLGLGTLSDGEPGMDPELLKQLYCHARNDDGRRQLFTADPSFAKGWVNLDSEKARELIAAFVPLDDAPNLKEARRNAQNNLEAQAWNDLLKIDMPPIVCKVKIHGAKWGLRFQSAESTMRGQEVLNEDLPPTPASSCLGEIETAARCEPPSPNPSSGELALTQAVDADTAAVDVLKRAGLPS